MRSNVTETASHLLGFALNGPVKPGIRENDQQGVIPSYLEATLVLCCGQYATQLGRYAIHKLVVFHVDRKGQPDCLLLD